MTDRKADKVDLNTASRDDLIAVPGIGDAGADAIVKHRREHGRFKSVDDVVNVTGIGAATLETAKPHLIASTNKGGEGGGAAKRAAEKPAEMARKAGEAGADVLRRAGESAAEGARATAAAAPEVVKGAAEAARRTGAGFDAAARDAFPGFRAEGMEDLVRAGEIFRDRSSEFGRLWMSFWSEQLTDGMATMRALAGCRTWHEALEVQGEFTRASVERAWSRTVQSAEITADMMGGGFRLPQGIRPPGRSRVR